MTFLNPLFLIGISAFALPLIIHLIFKKKAKVIPFPSVVFLREIDREVVRKKRVEEVLVMILRMLVLIFFALFLSKPVLRTNLLGGGSKAVMILLDDSYSMNVSNGRRSFDVAKEKARVLIANLNRSDRAGLVLTSRDPKEGFKGGILSGDRLGMTRWVDSLECGYSSSNLDTAFTHAGIVLWASNTKNRGIFLVSDLQRRDWEGLARKEKKGDIPVVLIDVAGSSIPLNAGITDIKVITTAEKRLGRTFTFRVQARNFSPRPFEGRIGMYTAEQMAIAQTRLTIPPESIVEKEVRFNPAGDGWHSGYFLVEKDDLPTDDRRYYSLEVKEGIPVGIFRRIAVAPADFDEVFFLSKLIDPTGRGYPFAVEELFVISGETLRRHAVVIFPSLLKFREGEMSALKSYVNSGGRAIFFLEEGFPVETARELFGEIATTNELEEGLFKVGEEGFGLENLFTEVMFHRRIPLSSSAQGEATAISLFQDGKPFLVEKRLGSGKLAVFATAFHVDYTDLPFRHASLPLIYNLLFRLTGKGEPREYLVGEEVIIRSDWTSITTPRGETIDLAADRTFYRPEVPGIYEVAVKASSSNGAVRHLPVNVDPREGELLTITSESDIDKTIPFSRWERVGPDENLKAKLQDIISGTPLGDFFLYAAIVAFLMELYLASKIGQKV